MADKQTLEDMKIPVAFMHWLEGLRAVIVPGAQEKHWLEGPKEVVFPGARVLMKYCPERSRHVYA